MSHRTGVNILFRINYHTNFGQNLMICGSIPELGNWKRPIPMTYHALNDEWSLIINIPHPKNDITINYKYIVDNLGKHTYEPQKDHVINISRTAEDVTFEIIDTYQWSDHILDAYSRSAFVDAIHRRNSPKQVNYILTPKTPLEIFFSCIAPNLKSNEKLVVIGSCPELGCWDPKKAVELLDNDFPTFSACISLNKSSLPFEYKYAIIRPSGEVIWDGNSNLRSNILSDPNSPGKTVLCLNQYFINPEKSLFHGFGIYAPLFSLRTSDSCGIGQFTDIKKLVDLCNKIGSSMIQLLPINDTTDKGDWNDCYPYRQVSCFALHPVYIDLLHITPNLPSKLVEEIKAFACKQEEEKWLNYPDVYQFKRSKLHQIYELIKPSLQGDVKFNDFKKVNSDWLDSYCLYCHFRDRFGTSDFHTWPEHRTINDFEIESLTKQHEKELEFLYWLQFVCDQQFREVNKYAAEHHVALKGDLPIGVHLNSVECWAHPRNFRLDMCAGAPPDAFSDQGQNWSFPTYDWDYMEKDNYRWWTRRLERMSSLFHALRVDHILGFFRIWEIPRATCVSGMLGHFFPCNATSRNELLNRGLWDIDRYVKPYVRWHLLSSKFGNEAEWVSRNFFNSRNCDAADDWYDFKDEFNSEKKIVAACQQMFKDDPEKYRHYRTCLLQLIDDVLMVKDPVLPDVFHPRTEITIEHIELTPNGHKNFYSPSWLELPEPQKSIIKEFYHEFTYKRQNNLWVTKAKPKLQLLKNSTNMLICAEDLGQLTDSILEAIESEALLSLRVQRMSKDPKKDFDDFQSFSYLSVCCPSTHDCSSLRGWWEENYDVINKFWNKQFGRPDSPCKHCEPWVSESILKQHLFSNSMWAIFLLQDVTGITQNFRRQTPMEEQINFPSDPENKWKYRYPYTLEELINDNEFTSKVHELCSISNRI